MDTSQNQAGNAFPSGTEITPDWILANHRQQQEVNAQILAALANLQSIKLSPPAPKATDQPLVDNRTREVQFERKHKLGKVQPYDGSDRSLFPQFRTKLEMKLEIDGPIIGSAYDQLWFAFGCLEGAAAARLHPWMVVTKDTASFTKDGFFAQLESAFGDPRLVEKAVEELHRTRQGKTEFRTFLAQFEQKLLEARGFGWEDVVKKGLLRRALSREMMDRMVVVEESSSYDGYCAQLRGVADRLEEVNRTAWHRPRTNLRGPHTSLSADSMDWQTGPVASSRRRTTGERKEKPLLVSKEEVNKRREMNLCLKCGSPGHYARECRTGWKSSLQATKVARTAKNQGLSAAVPRPPIVEVDSGTDSEESGKE